MRSRFNGYSIAAFAAILFLAGNIFTVAGQNGAPAKRNARGQEDGASPGKTVEIRPEDIADYVYEFSQPKFQTKHLRIEHDATGKGKLTFERLDTDQSIFEPIQLSDSARERILRLWEELNFLEAGLNYQSPRQYPQMGTIRIGVKREGKERTTEFNWTNDKPAFALADEYRRVADQALFLFDLSVARQNQPLETTSLMDYLESLIVRKAISDPKQLIPVLEDLSTDERVPLITRNHAARILKKIQK